MPDVGVLGIIALVRALTAGEAVLVVTTACSSGRDVSRSTTEPPSTLNAAGCPAPDEAFCETATRVAKALASKNAAKLFEPSRADTIACADVNRDYFPQGRAGDVLEGHGLSAADLIVELVPDAYRERLDTITGGLDAAFSDELGDGGVRVIGVGTCGPDVAGRRTYQQEWTAGLGDGADASRRAASNSPSTTTGASPLPISTCRSAGRPSMPTRSRTRSARLGEPPGHDPIV